MRPAMLPVQVLEGKLRALERFLLDAAARRKNRGFGKSAGGVSAGAGAAGLFGYLEDGTNRYADLVQRLVLRGTTMVNVISE